MFKKYIVIVFILINAIAQAQKVKVEWVSGDVTVYKKGTTTTSKVKKSETIEPTDRLFLGDKSLLVVSDGAKKLFEVKKKGYITGKELSEGLAKTVDSEYQRYMAYILKELKSHEGEMKSTEKGIPGAPSRGDEFMITMPDTIKLFSYEQLPVRWISSINTEMVNVQLVSGKKNTLLDLDVSGDLFWFNNINTYFMVSKSLTLLIYERRTDGNKPLKSKVLVLQANINEEKTKKDFEEYFKEITDPRFNQIAKAVKWEINHYHLKALDIYKILLLDYPDDELVKTSFAAFTARTGLE
ncbi:MAG: hypothetical protein ACKVQB_10285 [Bacteroidia bacterium]